MQLVVLWKVLQELGLSDCLVAAIFLCLAFSAARVAWDTLFVEFSAGL